MGLHDLSGKEQQFQHAYEVSGWGCRISRVRQTRSYMPTRYQDEAAGSHGFGTSYSTCLERIRMGLQDLTGKEHQIVHTYEVSGLGCKETTVLTRKEQQFQHAYEVSGWGCRISRVRNIRSNMHTRYQVVNAYKISGPGSGSHWFGPTDSTCLQGSRSGPQDLTGKAHQIEPAYTVSRRGCRISRIGNYRSYMPTRYQEVTSGSHGFETRDRTRL